MYAYMNTKNPFYDPSVWRNRAAYASEQDRLVKKSAA